MADPVLARKMWRTLEPYHGLIYFTPHATSAYAELGITGRMGYFASRAAAMGPVPAGVVIATFYNFRPALVRSAIPAAWSIATPAQLLDARRTAADRALREALGDDVLAGADVVEAATLARRAADACIPDGRPLYAAHADLAWPDEPHLALFHAVTLLREFRGDGHLAALVVHGIDGCEALVTHAAAGDVPAGILQSTRGWSDDEWAAATDRLVARGIVADGGFTDAGRALRQSIEDATDERAMAPWIALGDADADRLRELVRPLSKAIVGGGVLGNPPG